MIGRRLLLLLFVVGAGVTFAQDLEANVVFDAIRAHASTSGEWYRVIRNDGGSFFLDELSGYEEYPRVEVVYTRQLLYEVLPFYQAKYLGSGAMCSIYDVGLGLCTRDPAVDDKWYGFPGRGDVMVYQNANNKYVSSYLAFNQLTPSVATARTLLADAWDDHDYLAQVWSDVQGISWWHEGHTANPTAERTEGTAGGWNSNLANVIELIAEDSELQPDLETLIADYGVTIYGDWVGGDWVPGVGDGDGDGGTVPVDWQEGQHRTRCDGSGELNVFEKALFFAFEPCEDWATAFADAAEGAAGKFPLGFASWALSSEGSGDLAVTNVWGTEVGWSWDGTGSAFRQWGDTAWELNLCSEFFTENMGCEVSVPMFDMLDNPYGVWMHEVGRELVYYVLWALAVVGIVRRVLS